MVMKDFCKAGENLDIIYKVVILLQVADLACLVDL